MRGFNTLNSIVMAGVLSGSALAAEPLAYEGFNYGAGPNLQLANGGVGWSTSWHSINILPTGIAIEGMQWPNLQTSGRMAFTAAYQNSNFTQYSRGLASYGDLDAIYISVLVEPYQGYGLVGGLAFGTWTNGMVMGACPTGKYGLMTPPNDLADDSAQSVVQNQRTLLVAEVTKNGDATITWSLYVNPVVGQPMPAHPNAHLTVPGTALPQALMIYNDGGFATDEIRVGAEWASVLPPIDIFSPADFNQDGVVDVTDLFNLLAHWGDCPDCPTTCPQDVAGSDCVVNVNDLFFLLANWG